MSEYLAVAEQTVLLNQAAVFNASIPCRSGYVFHEDETGIFILRGIVNNPYAEYTRYEVDFSGNVAIPTGGTVGSVGVALSVNGETRQSSLAITTPAAVEEYENVTSTATIIVPRGSSFTVSVRYVAADPAVVPTPSILMQNGNLRIRRVA